MSTTGISGQVPWGLRTGAGGSNWGLFSLFAKADYVYNDKYLLSATLRRDGLFPVRREQAVRIVSGGQRGVAALQRALHAGSGRP